MTIQSRVRRLRSGLPWWAKLFAKLALARLPLPYRWWKRLGLFEHGHMEEPSYALQVVRDHVCAAFGDDRIPGIGNGDPAAAGRPVTVLELGPGDSIFGGMAARALGAERVILVDNGPYARIDGDSWRSMAAHLAAEGLPAPAIDPDGRPTDLLEACRIQYLTDGLRSLRSLPTASVALIYSQAALEHVRRAEFEALIRELRRIIAPEGRCSHVVDLKDHLAEGLHHLRFRAGVWESRLMARSGFYTNRLRHAEMLRIFSECGFAVQSMELRRWPALPIRQRALHVSFRQFDGDELRISGFRVVLVPA